MKNSLLKLKAIVFKQRPTLGRIYQVHGSDSLWKYVNGWATRPADTSSDLFFCFQEAVRHMYPADADEIVRQFADTSLVSTIDHHGILNHPTFVNTNFVYGLRRNQKYLIVLPTAGVSMNNTSSYSGCLLLNGINGLSKISIFPNRFGMHPVFSMTAFTSSDIQNVLKKIRSSDFSARQKEVAGRIAETVLMPEAGRSDFSIQSVRTSSALWNMYFPESPQLVYIPLEDVISQTLIRLLNRRNDFFSFLLCSAAGLDMLERHFQGLPGAFTGPFKGSFLFWGVDDSGRRIHLQRSGGSIEGSGLHFSIQPEDVIHKLQNRIVYPTSLLCFLVLLYSQVDCVGGFTQTTWLTEIQRIFFGLLEEYGDGQRAKLVGLAHTENFAETNILFLRNQKSYAASGIDVLCENSDGLYEKYTHLSRRMPMQASIDSMLPEIYRVVVPCASQDSTLLAEAESELQQDNFYDNS